MPSFRAHVCNCSEITRWNGPLILSLLHAFPACVFLVKSKIQGYLHYSLYCRPEFLSLGWPSQWQHMHFENPERKERWFAKGITGMAFTSRTLFKSTMHSLSRDRWQSKVCLSASFTEPVAFLLGDKWKGFLSFDCKNMHRLTTAESHYFLIDKQRKKFLFTVSRHCWRKKPELGSTDLIIWGFLAFSKTSLLWQVKKNMEQQRPNSCEHHSPLTLETWYDWKDFCPAGSWCTKHVLGTC